MAFSLHDNSHSALARDMDDLLQANQNLKQYITSYPFVCHFASIGLYGHARIAISHLQILNHLIHNNASMDYTFVFEDDPKLINDFLMTKTVTAAIKGCGHGIFFMKSVNKAATYPPMMVQSMFSLDGECTAKSGPKQQSKECSIPLIL